MRRTIKATKMDGLLFRLQLKLISKHPTTRTTTTTTTPAAINLIDSHINSNMFRKRILIYKSNFKHHFKSFSFFSSRMFINTPMNEKQNTRQLYKGYGRMYIRIYVRIVALCPTKGDGEKWAG